MNYIERVTDSLRQPTVRKDPIPTEIVGHALDLRTSPQVVEAFKAQADKLNLSSLSTEQINLARTRIAGSIATRFALASFYTPNITAFIDLDESRQSATIHSLVSDYADSLLDKRVDTVTPSLILDPSLDPLAAMSHKTARGIVYKSRMASMSPVDHLELIHSYINLTPGSFPKTPHTIAPIATNDATFTQAFGRDDITDKELIRIKNERMKLGEDKPMMEYLDSIHFRPGPSNDALAESVHQILNGTHPNEQMIQWEVAFSLWKRHLDTYETFEDYLHILWPSRDFYPTFEVKRDSIEAMNEIGTYNPAELAHGDMMIRALGIISKQGVIADPIETAIPFDPTSSQPHVRNAKSWVVREFLTRSEHILRGRVKF
jgi:hypothetical protein